MRTTAIAPVVLVLAGLCAGCATSGDTAGQQPRSAGFRPSAESAEGGLWMVMDRLEGRLKQSGQVVDDPALNAYVRHVLCTVAPKVCPGIRLYIVRRHGFNASMAPNGAMYVWTGLLLRAEDEAQLAFVLGHEVAHFTQAHSIKRWEDARAKTDFLGFFMIISAAGGIAPIWNVATAITMGSVFAFSRDQEREADRIGLKMMRDAGYDPREAETIWKNLMEEQKALNKDRPSVFFSTHPSPKDRIAEISREAARIAATGAGRPPTKGREAYREALKGWRQPLLREELRSREFKGTQVLLDRLAKAEPPSGMLQFFQGELYRIRAGDGDLEKAAETYERAATLDGAPPKLYRSLGLVLQKLKRDDAAAKAYATYLQRVPDAEDRLMIETYIQRMEKKQ